MVASFLRGLPETSEDEGEEMPPELVVLEFSQWVPWKAERCETPEWWTELSTVPEREKIAESWLGKCQASFGLPWQMQEIGMREATLQAPPALPWLCRQKFMLPAQSIYACRDIREILGKSGGVCWGPPALARTK